MCHPSEVEGYARSAMAHSLRRPGQEPAGEVALPNVKITMSNTSAGFLQHRDSNGETDDYEIAYVVGSGNHASGYLVNLGGHLFQSPVAYYRSRQAYDVAPGFEKIAYPDFTRPVAEGCVFCHAGRDLHVRGTYNLYRQPIFPEEAISCERCHGPAERHLAAPRAGTIVNPAKLPPAARDSICEQCHLFGASRVLNPGKEFNDFLPGRPTEETFTTYHDALPPGSAAAAFKVISHVEQLALSVCARRSDHRLWCGTCHDPHNKPLEPVAFYRSRCLTCHTSAFPAPHPAKDSDCIHCHMPRRDAKDGGHSAFTDHRIQRRPETQPDLPENVGIAAWREPSADLQKRNLGIASIEAGMQRHSRSLIIQGYRTLTEIQAQFTSDPDVFSWLGQALLLGGQFSEAEIAFDRALQLNPRSAENEMHAASAYSQAGDAATATTHLERAVSLDPLFLQAAGPLVGIYRRQGRAAEADALAANIASILHPSPESTKIVPKNTLAHPQKAAEEAYKNIQVLKGVPAEQLIPTMRFMASSLGADCAFCHVPGQFDKDDKKTKQTARGMMRMVLAINKENFDGRRGVTCYSCHRGAQDPVSVPSVGGDAASKLESEKAQTADLSASLPTVAEILGKYVNALGGAAAMERIKSRTEKGTVTTSHETPAPVEIFTALPSKQESVWHLSSGESITVYDGHSGWSSAPGRPVRPLEGVDLDIANFAADLQFPIRIQEIFPDLRIQYPEKIGDREAYLLEGVREGRPPVKLYFDQQSGLLVRIVLYADSPLGFEPTEAEYADYREVDGVLVPFLRTVSEPASRSTIRIVEVRQNVEISESHFTQPANSTVSQHKN